MPLLSSALRSFLTVRSTQFNRDLIDRFIAGSKVEVQVNPREDIGEPIENRRSRSHDGLTIYAIRYPDSAGTEPDWSDRSVGYPFDDYAQEIGSTGFSSAGSLWVGFDIDAILGHAPGHGIEQSEIDRIDHECATIPYVELRRSTGGAGRHLYVLVTGFDTANHTEHKALARAVLGKICHDTGYDFAPSVDCLGSNLWIWSRRATDGNRGFELLKESSQVLTPADVPNWRSHVDVVQHRRTKVQVSGLNEEEAASYPKVRKDAEHDRIFDEYRRHGYSLIFQPDHGCYQLHTGGLANTHKSLGLRGAFKTLTDDSDPGKPNAFAFLRPNGGLFVVRFQSTEEHPLWSQTAKGQVCIAYNVPLDPKAACRAVDGAWFGNGFTCESFEQAKSAAALFGVDLPELSDRPLNFLFKGSKMLVMAARTKSERAKGWGTVGHKFVREWAIDIPVEEINHDALFRHLVDVNDKDAGWELIREDGTLGMESKGTIADVLISERYDREGAVTAIGMAARRPFRLVNEPFQPAFLSGRRRNKSNQQLIVPSQSSTRSHPHFDLILAHNGRDLDGPVGDDPHCIDCGIKNGADYLRLWAASMVQRPKQPLPVLFFWSEENNTGKSSFHRGLSFLFQESGGAVDVYLSLMEKFNDQLAGTVLGYVEDKRLNSIGYSHLKSWTDSPTIMIRAMQTNAYRLPNYFHGIVSANTLTAIPVEPFDERIVVIYVSPYEGIDIDWTTMMAPALRREAPDFLATLLATPLPSAKGRLFLPVLETDSKRELMRFNSDGESTDNRRAVVDALVAAIVELVSNVEHWRGYAGNLLKIIGPGPWSNSAGTLTNYLVDTMTPLQERGIILSIAPTQVHGQREINIGQMWLTEPEWSDDELGEDEMRVADLQI